MNPLEKLKLSVLYYVEAKKPSKETWSERFAVHNDLVSLPVKGNRSVSQCQLDKMRESMSDA